MLKKGKVIEQGTHESLLDNKYGAYWALVNAQMLTLGTSNADESDLIQSTMNEPLVQTMSSASAGAKSTDEAATWKTKGFFNSFGRLLYEQTIQWPFYVFLLAGCLAAATANPIQAWLFAKLLSVAALPFDQLSSASSYWALMFFILALCTALAYFTLGASSNAISVVGYLVPSSKHEFNRTTEHCLHLPQTIL